MYHGHKDLVAGPYILRKHRMKDSSEEPSWVYWDSAFPAMLNISLGIIWASPPLKDKGGSS